MSRSKIDEVDVVQPEALGDDAGELVVGEDAALDEDQAGGLACARAAVSTALLDGSRSAKPRSTTTSPMRRTDRPRAVGWVSPVRRSGWGSPVS